MKHYLISFDCNNGHPIIESNNVITFNKLDCTYILDGYVLDDNLKTIDHADIDIRKYQNGNFSYIQVDNTSKSVKCYSDTFASKNLFYFTGHKRFYISNDINAIIQHVDKKPNYKTIYNYLEHGFINVNDETFFNSIYRLEGSKELLITYNNNVITTSIKEYITFRENDLSLPINDVLDQIEYNVHKIISTSNQKPPLLSLSSGYDSNLIKLILEKNNTVPDTITYVFGCYNYDEHRLNNTNYQLNSNNYKVTSYEDLMCYLSDYIALTGQPINGLPTIGTIRASRYVKDAGYLNLITGIGDGIWFNSTLNELNKFNNAGVKVKAADGTMLTSKSYLSNTFYLMHKDMMFNYSCTKYESSIKNYINEQQMVFKGPRVNYDNYVSAMVNNIDHIQPYLTKKNFELVLSLNENIIHFNDTPKSLIVNLINRLNKKTFKTGLSMISPQRELIKFNYKKSIIKLINNSLLSKDNIIDTEKLFKQYLEYTENQNLGNSYFIWKFIVTEIWYRLYFYNLKTDLYLD